MRARTVSTVLALVVACPGAGLAAAPTAAASGRGATAWEAAQQVSPVGQVTTSLHVVSFPDGSAVAVWVTTSPDPVPEDPGRAVLRSTRPAGGEWGDPVVLPVEHVDSVSGVAPQTGGRLVIAYELDSGIERGSQVRTWFADGSVGPVSLAASESWSLSADVEGDMVAIRLGAYDPEAGFARVVRYSSGGGWRRLPTLAADPRDLVVPGPGDVVWMSGYDEERTVLRVRRWTPRLDRWRLAWSRDYPGRSSSRPRVDSLDLAVSGTGHLTVAFHEQSGPRERHRLLAVERSASGRWTRPVVLQRVGPDSRRTTTGPVVAVAGARSLVGWTVSGPTLGGMREVRVAPAAHPDRQRVVDVVPSREGFRGLQLDVDLGIDGTVLVTYLPFEGGGFQVVAATGAPGGLGDVGELVPTVLFEDASLPFDTAVLGEEEALVLARVRDGSLLSRAQPR